MLVDNKQKIADNQQFWDVKKAGERLLWRFGQDDKGNFKNFTPNDQDFIALKSVLAWMNRQSSGIIENSPLFAKLYILQLVGEIRENKTTVFNDHVFAKISNQLAKPLELFYTTFYDDLVANQFTRLTPENFKTKEGDAVLMDVIRFKETFPIENIVSELNDRMIKTLHRRSNV
jgi:hypothetical protein